MLSNTAYVLLDTMVVLGFYGSRTSSFQGGKSDADKWQKTIETLLGRLNVSNFRITVPTPVCYELTCHGSAWKDFFPQEPDIFRYAEAYISHDILKRAAEYSLSIHPMKADGKEGKVKTMDPIIAAYSLDLKYYLLTENQQDYPEPYFSLVATEAVVLTDKTGNKYRRLIHLLKPKTA